MRVVIVGGGIAGLALASSLEKAEIDYILLESRDRTDPQVGASIAINAGSLRALDQLGAAQEIIDHSVPINTVKHHNPDGTLISKPSKDWKLLGARFFYETAFIDRQFVLRALSNSIQQKKKIRLNHRVKCVEQSDVGVKVQCEDGTSFSGDVLIGCDGVNSKIRSEMWRIAEKVTPGYFELAEKSKMSADYRCLFGISAGLDKLGMTIGDVDYTYDKGSAFLVFCGKAGRTYWFLFQKMDRVYYRHQADFPRFTQEDAARTAEENGWRPCHSQLRFRDLWKNRVSATLVPMEECLFEKWSWERIAVVGDGSHKMTANHGAAGNNAIESAIAMANSLHRISTRTELSSSAIHRAFIEWQKKRQARINDTVKAAAMICRMHGQETWKDRLMTQWVMPLASSFLSDIYRDQIIGAELLEYLPVPERSFLGNTPFNPHRGIGFEPDIRQRATRALPLLVIPLVVQWFSSDLTAPSFAKTWDATYATSDFELLLYVANFVQLYAIWMIEGARLGNKLSLMQIPFFFGVLSMRFGCSTIAPWYFFFHYLGGDISKFVSADARLTSVGFTRTIIPIVLTVLAVPYFFTIPTVYISWYWTLSPVLVAALQNILVQTSVSPDTADEDRLKVGKLDVDIGIIRFTSIFFSAGSMTVWLLWLYHLRTTTMDTSTFAIPWVALMISSIAWISLLLNDLKQASMLEDWSWAGLASVGMAVLILGGPMTAVTLGWEFREEILLTRPDGTAMVKENFSGRSVLEVQAQDLPAGN